MYRLSDYSINIIERPSRFFSQRTYIRPRRDEFEWLDDKEKKTACFPQQFERSKVEWSIRQDKIFFPDAFEGQGRLESAESRTMIWKTRRVSRNATTMKINAFNLSSRKEANRKLHSPRWRYPLPPSGSPIKSIWLLFSIIPSHCLIISRP